MLKRKVPALFSRISTTRKEFSLLLIKWLPESQNKAADMLARQALQKFYSIKSSTVYLMLFLY